MFHQSAALRRRADTIVKGDLLLSPPGGMHPAHQHRRRQRAARAHLRVLYRR